MTLPSLTSRPDKAPTFQTFAEETCPLPVPPDDLEQVAPAATQHQHVPGIRILGNNLPSLGSQGIEPAPHVRHPGGQPNPNQTLVLLVLPNTGIMVPALRPAPEPPEMPLFPPPEYAARPTG